MEILIYYYKYLLIVFVLWLTTHGVIYYISKFSMQVAHTSGMNINWQQVSGFSWILVKASDVITLKQEEGKPESGFIPWL